MTANELRSKRVAAEISASLLAATAKVNRTRLSQIERGYIQPTDDEIRRLEAALQRLIRAKAAIQEAASTHGWPLEDLR
jgi:transcriptional regulator with XRE-family HTH domain